MTRIEEIKLRAVAPTCAPYSTIRADVDYLLAENKRMREALQSIAQQHLEEELPEEVSPGDYVEGYDECIRVARAALKGIEP